MRQGDGEGEEFPSDAGAFMADTYIWQLGPDRFQTHLRQVEKSLGTMGSMSKNPKSYQALNTS